MRRDGVGMRCDGGVLRWDGGVLRWDDMGAKVRLWNEPGKASYRLDNH